MKNKKAILGFVALVAIGAFLTACGGGNKPASQGVNNQVDSRLKALGAIPVPADNPMGNEKVELGKMLYFDNRLSGDNSLSCAVCHNPGMGYGDGVAKFTGFQGFKGPRNSPTVINSGYYKTNFWDGRAKSLEEQALGPIQAAGEMNQKLDELVVELKAVPDYEERFKKVFGGEITSENIAKAIAAFERTIVVNNSAYDKYLAGDANALTPEAKRGLAVFSGKGNCITCHNGPTLGDDNFYNIGLKGDEGRFKISNDPKDKGAFRTAQLRGITYTAPYMHDGSLATLEAVVDYYDKGGDGDANTSSLIKPLGLTAGEKGDLTAFLKSLGGTPPQVAAPKLP